MQKSVHEVQFVSFLSGKSSPRTKQLRFFPSTINSIVLKRTEETAA